MFHPHFHIALAVPHIETAMADLAATGVQWRDVLSYPLCVFHDAMESLVQIRSVYSSGDTPAIELFEGGAGTPMEAPIPGSHFHHIGVWTDDFSADVAKLQTQGWELAATVADEHGDPSTFALHRTPFGFYLELVDPRWAGRLLGDLLPPQLKDLPVTCAKPPHAERQAGPPSSRRSDESSVDAADVQPSTHIGACRRA